MNPSTIPAAMRKARRWLTWRLERRGEAVAKVPYYPNGSKRYGELDTPEDAKRLGTFDEALAALGSHMDNVGLGFALGGGFDGVDLDKCRDPKTGKVEAWARAILKRFKGYVELSPSGRGFHLHGKANGSLATIKNDGAGVEYYDGKRFFTITGKALGRSRKLGNISSIYPLLVARSPQQPKPTIGEQRRATPASWSLERARVRAALDVLDPDCPRDEWLNYGMAIHDASGGSAEGFAIWDAWSKRSATKYIEADIIRDWKSFDSDRKGARVTIGTLYHAAKSKGFDMNAGLLGPSNVLVFRAPDADPEGEVDPLVEFIRAWTPHVYGAAKPVEFYVDGLIEAKRAVGLVSPGGVGKTSIAMNLGVSTALGSTWFDLAVKQGSFVLLSLDDVQDDLSGALDEFVAARGLKPEERDKVAKHVRLMSLVDFAESLRFVVEDRGNIIATKLADRLCAALGDIPDLRCVMLDTVRQFAGAEVNINLVMTIVTKAVTMIAQRLNCAAIAPHHMTKAGAREGQADQHSGAGGGAFGDNLRVILVLTPITRDELKREYELAPLDHARLDDPDVQIIKMTDTRGSLRRRALKPIYVWRQGWNIGSFAPRKLVETEVEQRDIERVVDAVRSGATSNKAVRAVLGGSMTKVELMIERALLAGRIVRELVPGRGRVHRLVVPK